MAVEIVYPSERLFPSFHEALAAVARERVYIEMVEPPPLDAVSKFQRELIAKNGPVYYAVDGERVVGWADVFPNANLRLSHRGNLGMGLIETYRGKGLGRQLLTAVIDHSKKFGLEKIELSVYTSNLAAIALYEKLGFEREGLIKNYRKLDGRYFDCILMAKFL